MDTDSTSRTATTWATYLRRLPPPHRLRQIREAAEVSRAQVAQELDVSVALVGLWERGARRPGRRFIRPYVELLERLQAIAEGASTDDE